MSEENAPGDLESSIDQLRQHYDTAAAWLLEHLATLESQPTWSHDPDPARGFDLPFPSNGRALPELLEWLRVAALPPGRNAAHPSYLAYVPGGGLPEAALADWIAATLNRFTGLRAAAPGLVALENITIGWLCQSIGYPRHATGALLSGGSLANWSAVIAARERYWPGSVERFSAGRAYLSDQTHDSIAKAVRLAGFPETSLRTIRSRPDSRFDLDALEQAIRADRAAGHQPFLVVGTAGNVNTGAIDPLPALAELAERHQLWFHVDAAYGGSFGLTARGRARLAGIERADSVTLDPHKGLFLPFGTGAILVRDPDSLRRAQAIDADYLPGVAHDGLLDPCQLTPELSRPFRALRLWLPVQMHGVDAWRRALDEKLDLAHESFQRLTALDGIDCVTPPELSLFAFRDRRGDDFNAAWLEHLNRQGRLHLSSTRWRSALHLRWIVLNFRTHHRHVEQALAELIDARQFCQTANP
jgi:aromatic-L-amino-acid decarboxylase